MSEQNQYEVTAQKWLDRARIAGNAERGQEQRDSSAIASIYRHRALADLNMARGLERATTDANYDSISLLMQARADMVAYGTAIALIEHLEDDFTPVEIVTHLQEQTVSMLVQRSSQGTSSSALFTEQVRLEVQATVLIARTVGVK